MFAMQMISGFIVYFFMAYISYHEGIKNSKYYFLLGMLVAVVASFVWLYVAKMETNSSRLLVKSFFWDSMVTIIYVLVPVIAFNAKINFTQGLGFLIVCAGLIVIKTA